MAGCIAGLWISYLYVGVSPIFACLMLLHQELSCLHYWFACVCVVFLLCDVSEAVVLL